MTTLSAPRGHVAIVGLGPGSASLLTPESAHELERATDWVGYGRYLMMASRLVTPDPSITRHGSGNRVEADRARLALDLAGEGRRVAVISSGDPGVFAMASVVIEMIAAGGPEWSQLEVSVHPGVSAAQAAAARVGAPLGHDFCVISLSDNLKPWSVIEQRLHAAAAADFVLALYNPRSRHRPEQFGEAVHLIARYRAASTPVVLAHDVYRPAERVEVVTLEELATSSTLEGVGMRTVVIIGSSQTRQISREGTPLVFTPRSYPAPD